MTLGVFIMSEEERDRDSVIKRKAELYLLNLHYMVLCTHYLCEWLYCMYMTAIFSCPVLEDMLSWFLLFDERWK